MLQFVTNSTYIICITPCKLQATTKNRKTWDGVEELMGASIS
jgi:hypothetical protein